MAAEWYFRVMGADFGPISAPELVRQAAEGRIGRDTRCARAKGPGSPPRGSRGCSTVPARASPRRAVGPARGPRRGPGRARG